MFGTQQLLTATQGALDMASVIIMSHTQQLFRIAEKVQRSHIAGGQSYDLNNEAAMTTTITQLSLISLWRGSYHCESVALQRSRSQSVLQTYCRWPLVCLACQLACLAPSSAAAEPYEWLTSLHSLRLPSTEEGREGGRGREREGGRGRER